MTVLLIGDKPSDKNTDPKVAFMGTKSHATLLKWCHIMNIESPIFKNRVDSDIYEHVLFATISEMPIIALGNAADVFLSKANVKYFKLPHPSGRNHKPNDKKWLLEQLQECKRWARSVAPGEIKCS